MKILPTALQPGLDRGDALAGFDGGGTGHGANNGLAAGQIALGLGVHGRCIAGARVRLPSSVGLDGVFMAKLRGLGYGG